MSFDDALTRMPHKGRMLLIARVLDADAEGLTAEAVPHRAPDFPLRLNGRLATVALAEIGAQAAAAHASGARQVLMTRWPMPATVRDGMLDLVQQGWASVDDLPRLVGHAQRIFVANAERSGQVERAHPRFWAGWLAFGRGP